MLSLTLISEPVICYHQISDDQTTARSYPCHRTRRCKPAAPVPWSSEGSETRERRRGPWASLQSDHRPLGAAASPEAVGSPRPASARSAPPVHYLGPPRSVLGRRRRPEPASGRPGRAWRGWGWGWRTRPWSSPRCCRQLAAGPALEPRRRRTTCCLTGRSGGCLGPRLRRSSPLGAGTSSWACCSSSSWWRGRSSRGAERQWQTSCWVNTQTKPRNLQNVSDSASILWTIHFYPLSN